MAPYLGNLSLWLSLFFAISQFFVSIKPGFVKTKLLQKNLKLPKILISNVNHVGNKIFKAHKNKKNTLYVPRYWSIIMFIYKMIPETIFKIIAK